MGHPPNSEKPVDWELLLVLLREQRLKELSRKFADVRRYEEHVHTLRQRGMTASDYIWDFIFGRSGITVEPCFFVDILATEGEDRIFVFVQHDTESEPEVPWLDEYWSRNQRTAADLRFLREHPGRIVMITRNMFSYNLAENISHWLIWSNTELSQEETASVAENICFSFLYALHVNPEHNKSIKDIYHAHLFVNKAQCSEFPKG